MEVPRGWGDRANPRGRGDTIGCSACSCVGDRFLWADGGRKNVDPKRVSFPETVHNGPRVGQILAGYLIGVGDPSTYSDLLMDRVTDVGRGASVFIPHADEFRGRFIETMSVAARDVQIRYDLPVGLYIVRFSGEAFSTDPREIEPQHVAPSDAVVLHQQLNTPCAVAGDASIG